MLRYANIICGLFGLIVYTEASFNLYMNKTETKRLLGVSREMYYVRDGVVDDYALSFVLPIRPTIEDMYFNWYNDLTLDSSNPTESVSRRTLMYEMTFSVSNEVAMYTPEASVPATGSVPLESTVLSVKLKCTGKQTAEVDVTLTIAVKSLSSAEDVVVEIKRRKTCRKCVLDCQNCGTPNYTTCACECTGGWTGANCNRGSDKFCGEMVNLVATEPEALDNTGFDEMPTA